MDEPKKRVIDVTTPGEPSATSRPVIPSSQPPVADPTLAPAAAVPKKITIADEPVAPVLPSMTGPTVVAPSPPPPVEGALPSQPAPVEIPVQPALSPADDMQNIPRFGELQPKIDSHPLFSGTPDPAPTKPRRWLRRLTWIFSTLLVLLIAAYLLIDSGVVRGASHLPFHIFKQPVATTTTPAITPITTDPYAGWKTYTSKVEGFSIKYPAEWILSDTSSPQAGIDEQINFSHNNFSLGYSIERLVTGQCANCVLTQKGTLAGKNNTKLYIVVNSNTFNGNIEEQQLSISAWPAYGQQSPQDGDPYYPSVVKAKGVFWSGEFTNKGTECVSSNLSNCSITLSEFVAADDTKTAIKILQTLSYQ